MKCRACHHLNSSTEAECFLCGASLRQGPPPMAASLYIFIGLCVFLPVFSTVGGGLKVLELLGWNINSLRGTARPGIIPYVLAVLGVNGCLLVSRMHASVSRQAMYSSAIVGICWAVYLLYMAGLVSELRSKSSRSTAMISRHAPGWDRSPGSFAGKFSRSG